MSGPERFYELQQKLAKMPEAEASVRLRLYNDLLATAASAAFSRVCALGCSLDRLDAFAKEVAARLTAEEEIH